MSGKFEDIINLPHHTSDRHVRMPMHDRAAQFSPFAALTGYDSAIKETARLTDRKIELTEEEKTILDARLREAAETGESVRITCFVADDRKAGGSYVDTVGRVKRVDRLVSLLLMMDGNKILIDDIVGIEEVD